jgi:hypothetical protein
MSWCGVQRSPKIPQEGDRAPYPKADRSSICGRGAAASRSAGVRKQAERSDPACKDEGRTRTDQRTAHCARSRGPATYRRRAPEPRDRRASLPVRADGEDAYSSPPREAGSPLQVARGRNRVQARASQLGGLPPNKLPAPAPQINLRHLRTGTRSAAPSLVINRVDSSARQQKTEVSLPDRHPRPRSRRTRAGSCSDAGLLQRQREEGGCGSRRGGRRSWCHARVSLPSELPPDVV